MKLTNIRIAFLLFLLWTLPALSCERDIGADGYVWTFHRLADGNSYHEAQNLGEFTEGQTLFLTAPCPGRKINTVQVSWEDRHSEVYGELITMPGNRKHGQRDISDKRRESWTVDNPTDSLQFAFSGKRGHRCRVKWVRVFYGVNAPPFQPASSMKTTSYDLVDRIGLPEAAIQKKSRVISWDGRVLTVAVKTDTGQEVRYLRIGEFKNVLFAERWGTATDIEGYTFPVRVKRIMGGKIELDKKLDGKIVPKPLADISHYKSIIF